MHIALDGLSGVGIIDYPSNTYTPNDDIVTAKLLFKSGISTPNAKFLRIDLKDIYPQIPMERYEYDSLAQNVSTSCH